MLGQPVSMLIPRVVGFKLAGSTPAGATATDVVLTITEMLRKHGVVGKFVEFYGEGVAEVPLANRATIGNMSPEFGSTAAMFPIDDVTLDYLRLTGRSQENIDLVEAYAKEQGMWHDPSREIRFSEYLELDLSTVVPSIAGPKRPQDRIELSSAKEQFRKDIHNYVSDATDGQGVGRPSTAVEVTRENGEKFTIDHGLVSIASITSCTNTSNPSVMLAAAVLARNAANKGLKSKPWVKTSVAPGSKVVTEYYEKSGLLPYLEKLGFFVVGYGCTTCIGNSGPLDAEISEAINANDLAATAVLSGNRNFEGRINGREDELPGLPATGHRLRPGWHHGLRLRNRRPGRGRGRQRGVPEGHLAFADRGPADHRLVDRRGHVRQGLRGRLRRRRPLARPGDPGVRPSNGPRTPPTCASPILRGHDQDPGTGLGHRGARVLLKLGDSVTTDHISPAGSFKSDTPAGRYLIENGVDRKDFNSYGSRRGNHEVMIRGTFANIRIKNQLLDGVEGGFTRDFTQDGAPQSFVYDAAENYKPPAPRWWSWAARNTVRAPRVTGPPRAPRCWVSRP